MKVEKPKTITKGKVLLTFLKRVKAGNYTKIHRDVSVLERPETLREEPYFEEEEEAYYYSTR